MEGYKGGHRVSILVCMARVIIGVDEAGRGPLAGPVAVGIVAVMSRFNLDMVFPGLKDSKKLSEKKREEIYAKMQILVKSKRLAFIVVFSSHRVIDKKGITKAVARSVNLGLRKLAPKHHTVEVLLDGLLKAPKEYKQKTIIRGDESEPVISLASIAAKVERDWFMKKISKKYPEYFFEQHKGYGTKKHFAAINKFGLCDIHRRSYCKNIKTGA